MTHRVASPPRWLQLGFLLTACLTTAAHGSLPGGQNPASTRTLLLDACKLGTSVIAVGERGNIVRSENSGASWHPVATPLAGTLTGISFADTLHGWAVGHRGVILHTDDGGHTWSAQNKGVPEDVSLLDVAAVNARQAIAVGAFGACYITQDGRTWTSRKLVDEELHLNHAQTTERGEILIAGEGGTALRLREVRSDAEILQIGYVGTLNGLQPTSTGLLAFGLRGHAYRSNDDGASWQQAEGLPPVLLSTAVELSSGAVILAGQARVFLVSRDHGVSFESWQTSVTSAVAKLVEAPDGTLLVFGEDGVQRIEAPVAPEGARHP